MLPTVSEVCQSNVVTEVALLDESRGLYRSTIQDLQEANAFAGRDTLLTLCSDAAVLSDSEVVVLLPPSSRTMLRSPQAHRATHTALLRLYTKHIKQYAPTAKVLVAMPPANFLAAFVQRELEADGRQVIGLSSGIASGYLKTQIAAQLSVSVRDVMTLVIGNDDAVYPLPQYCRVNGIPIDQLLSPDRVHELTEMVNERQSKSIHTDVPYSLSVWISQIITAIALDRKRIMSVGALIQASTSTAYLSVPSKIGANGVEEIIRLDLTEAQRENFTDLVAKSMVEQHQ